MATVTAVLVARNGAKYLPATISALLSQTRAPDRVITVDAGSGDGSAALMRERMPEAQPLALRRGTLAQAVNQALGRPGAGGTDWYWFLGHDNAPHPDALRRLMGAVEVSPSVAIAGPKLMRWDEPERIVGFGESLTATGGSVQLVADELDQAQHDTATDVLGVAAPGMLVRADLWHALGGFDEGLPSVDAGLDLGVRARLAGHRVERVPEARVASAGPVELFGRRSLSAAGRNLVRRRAQLHRRFVYAPAIALPLLWLGSLPMAFGRLAWQLLAKRPSLALGELAAGLLAMFDGTVPRARSLIAHSRQVGWDAIAALRVTGRDAAELREREQQLAAGTAELPVDESRRPSFFGAGGGWAVLLAAAAGAVVFGRLFGAQALAGGALTPLGSLADLWGVLGVSWRTDDGGYLGSSDPFHALLALLGSVTWWSPSTAIVLLVIVAMPLSALGAWFAAARLARTGWGPSVAAIGWAAAPPLIAGISEGEIGAVIAHLLLPWLVPAVLDARRSWSMAAVAGLLLAAITASAPVLAPALVVLLAVLIVVQPHRIHRLVLIVVPAVALFAPLAIEQFLRGTPAGLLADPGTPVVRETPLGAALVLGAPTADFAGWYGFADAVGWTWLQAVPGWSGLAVAVAPLAAIALAGLFLRGGGRSIPALVVALAGLATAVLSAHLAVTTVDGVAAAIWPGSGLSLYWLGLLGAVAIGLDGLGRFAPLPGIAAVVGIAVAVVPLGVAAASGRTAVASSNGRVLPAVVAAEAASDPQLGTLVLTASGGDTIAASLYRGEGPLMERVYTLTTTRTELSEWQAGLAEVTGNLVSTSGMDLTTGFDEYGIDYVLLTADEVDSSAYLRAVDAISARAELDTVGQNALGVLFKRVGEPAERPDLEGPGTWQTTFGAVAALAQLVVFAVFVLLAVPTTRRRRVRAARAEGVVGQ